MATFKKKELNELVGGDIFSGGNDRNPTNDKEIETGPVSKGYDDKSDFYVKGRPTTSDRVFGRYRQNIPWFAVYSFGGTRQGVGMSYNVGIAEDKNVVTKKNVEEKIEDLVKKSKSSEITEKGHNPTFSKIIEFIKDGDFSEEQLEKLLKSIEDKKKD